MTDTNKLFELAQLAEASYANLLLGNSLEAGTIGDRPRFSHNSQ